MFKLKVYMSLALIGFYFKRFSCAYFFARKAVKHSTPSEYVVNLFCANVGILSRNFNEPLHYLKAYLANRDVDETKKILLSPKGLDKIWVDAFGDYLALICIDSLKKIRAEIPKNFTTSRELDKINTESVSDIYKRMFPIYLFPEVRRKLCTRDAGLTTTTKRETTKRGHPST